MLKQTISYHDFDDNLLQETLYFNVTKTELADNLHLIETLENMQRTFDGDKREMKVDEIRQIIDIVKTVMKLSYGVRSEDGKRFIKNEDLWVDFTQTAVYDAFLFSLFEDPSKAVAFITGILPKDMRNEAERAISQASAEVSKSISEEPAATGELTPEQQAEALAAYRASQRNA